jgi:8-oxo-dGTP diphosphatase
MSDATGDPRVGLGVVVFRDGKFLLGKRKGSHGAGEYSPPGGGLEHGESLEECAKREVMEEAGIEITNIRFLCVFNQRFYPPNHFVNIGLVADWKSGEPKVMEPEKCDGWDWFTLDDLPSPMFKTFKYYEMALKGEGHYWDPPQ